MSKIILGIETATKICSVAISDGKKLLAIKEEGGEYSHAENAGRACSSRTQQQAKWSKSAKENLPSSSPKVSPFSMREALPCVARVWKGLCRACVALTRQSLPLHKNKRVVQTQPDC